MRASFQNLSSQVSLWAILLSAPLSAWAQTSGVTGSFDDYDVPKYQRTFQEAAQRLNDAQALYGNLDQRVQQLSSRLNVERERLEHARREIQEARETIGGADRRIQELEQSGQNARQQMAQIESEIPSVEHAISEAEGRRNELNHQLAGASQNAERLESVARAKEQQNAPLQQSLEQKRQAVARAQGRINELTNRVNTLRQQKGTLQAQLERQRSGVAQTQNQLNTARASITQLQAEAASRQQASQAADADAAAAEQKAAEAQAAHRPDAPMLAVQAKRARALANAKRLEMQTAQQKLASAQSQIPALENSIAQQNVQITQTQNSLNGMDAQVTVAQQEVQNAQPQLAAAQQELNQAQAAAQSVLAEAQAARAQAQQAQTQVSAIRGQLTDAQRRMEALQARIGTMRQQQAELRNTIAQVGSRIQNERLAAENARQRMPELSERFHRSEEAVRIISNDVQIAARDRDQAANVVADNQRQTDFARQNVVRITENLRQAQAIATNEAQADGTHDGSVDGSTQGAAKGSSEGSDVGAREGEAKGAQDGVIQARTRGTQEGTLAGSSEGTQRGTPDGQQKGQSDGASKGRAEGLAAGYESGRLKGDTQGYTDGQVMGHKLGGVAKGRADGRIQGAQRASQDGLEKGRPEGYVQGERSFLDANLKQVTLSNGSGSALFAKTYNTAHKMATQRRYPHPLIQQVYNTTYQQTYNQAIAASYDRAYNESYRQAYDRAYGSAYQAATARDYRQEYSAAYDAARTQAYNDSYTRAYNEAYTQASNVAYTSAYQSALPERQEEGVRAGRTQGLERGKSEAYAADYDIGLAEGDNAAYNETFPKALENAVQQGNAEAVAYYSSNAVLKYDGAQLIDANEDGVFAPGEAVSISMAVKNFGKTSQSHSQEVTVQITNVTQGLIIEKASAQLTKIPGQSRALVTGIGRVRVSQAAEIGKAESVQVTVTQGGAVLGKVTLKLTVAYLYSVTSIDLKGTPVEGQTNTVAVQVKNVSSKTSLQEVSVRLVSTDGLATIITPTQSLGPIDAGGSREAILGFSFKEANQVLNFEIQVLEGGVLLGKRQFNTDTSQHYSFNPSANGLLVVSNNQEARDAVQTAKASGLAYDLWNTSLEGKLPSDTANKYVAKSIVLAGDVDTLDSTTAAALGSALNQGAKVLALRSIGSSRSSAGAVLAAAIKDLGDSKVAGLNVYEANYFLRNRSNAVVAAGMNGDATSLADRLFTFNLVVASTADQVTVLAALASSGGNRLEIARAVVTRELTKEMRDDWQIRGKNFENNRANLRNTAYINAASGMAPGPARKALASIYPDLEREQISLGGPKDTRRKAVGRVIAPLQQIFNEAG